MRRIEGAPIIPPGALLHSEIPMTRRRRNRIMEWVYNFQFRAKKIDVISRYFVSNGESTARTAHPSPPPPSASPHCGAVFRNECVTMIFPPQGPLPLHLRSLQRGLLDVLSHPGQSAKQEMKRKCKKEEKKLFVTKTM